MDSLKVSQVHREQKQVHISGPERMTMATDSWDTDVGYAAADCSVEEESLESLEAKLSEYQNSLQDVKSALKVSPDEPVRIVNNYDNRLDVWCCIGNVM